ncbi:cytochrome c oxidase assembly protein [Caulobacter sp. KR2-114]|uniref:cytochrome c oxidase assembly protein n=1 Tax=Caulobacter sp. KR2-114 TaxID=3400912 RepID=UPI003C058D70
MLRFASAATATAYCGAPPAPGALMARWNLDPILIAALLATLAVYIVGATRRQAVGSIPSWRRAAFAGGWTIGAAALVSPLCALSVSLFSARVGQHMILALIAAPLVILGRPGAALAALGPWTLDRLPGGRPLQAACGPASSAAAFAVALWIWHAPGPYDATFASPAVYWLMHLTVFAAALMVWNIMLRTAPESATSALAVGAASTLQMTFLGAIITLTPRLLYAPHALTPYAWGLTQASDQQLGGLIMWVPGCSIFLAVTLATLARAMSERARPNALA